jgi:photosystem II stability/assembly factor-like uncharacterized protein
MRALSKRDFIDFEVFIKFKILFAKSNQAQGFILKKDAIYFENINFTANFAAKLVLNQLKTYMSTSNFTTIQTLRSFAFAILALLVSTSLQAQEWMRSTENGGKPNFYEIQKDFNAYWEGRKIEKGKGYKQFKRWEWFWEQRVSPSGEFPEQGLTMREWEKYTLEHNVASQRTETTANWTAMGPTSSLGGYEGVGRINCIAFHPTIANTFFVGSPGGGLWRTTDGGTTWTCLTDNLPVLGVTSIAIDPTTPNTMYIATGDGYGNFDTKSVGVLKSTDGGVTWNSTGLSWTQNQQRVIGAMAIHPTNPQILLAATSVGIFRTANGGSTWSQITTFHTQDIKFKPGDPTIVYATSYGGTTGNVYRSTDTGATFTKITNFTTFNRINLAVTPADANLVVALCSKSSDNGFGGLYTSTNSGASFTLKYSAATKNLLGWSAAGNDSGGQGWYDLSVAVSPTNASTIIVGGVNTWRSTDGGTTFNQITAWTSGSTWNPNNVAVVHADKHFHAYHPINTGTLYECNDGGLYRSTNNGTSWTDITNGLGITQFYRLSNAQTDANQVLCGAQDNGTKRRASAGTWSMATGGDGMEAIIDHTNASYMYASYAQGVIYRSTNGFSTSSYTTISANIPGGQPTGAWVTPYVMSQTNASMLFAGYKDVFRTTDRGTSWTKISTNLSTTDLISLAVAPNDNNTIYAASYTKIYRTTNGGTNWSDISAGLPFASAKMTYITVHPTNSQTLYVTFSGYSSGNKVFKSTNGGTSWTNISGTLPNLPANCITIDKNGNEALYVGMDVGIFYRDASMNDWVAFNQGLPNVIVNELEIQYSSGKIRAATYGRGLWQSDLYTAAPATPTITSFTPTSGPVGTSVTITGTNFTGATAVRFNGTNATYTVNSATQITATVPSGATTGVITVVTPAGSANSATSFTVTVVTPAPTITSFTPASGPVGTSVTITGTNFTGATAVRFNGTNATYTVNSATQITATVPSGATTGVISVVTAGGTANSASSFTVTVVPSYCASGATNSADSRIDNVTFAGINNSSTTACATYTDFTSTSGNVNRSSSYSLSVTLGTCGGNYAKFGKVFIDWNNDMDFDDADELVATSASISATAAFTATVTVPAGAALGTTRMRVVCVETSSAANVNPCGTFTYGETEDYSLNIAAAVTPAPSIASFTPASGPVGTSVTITGTNFTGATAVRFNGTNATYTVNSATQITATVPSGATTGAISVVTAGGTANSSTSFTVTVPASYCASNATNSADSRINNVTFAGINNSSTAACATYTDFTSINANVVRGTTYSVSVTLGTCGGNYTKYGKVFIDWNGDGDFLDAGETVATSGAISATAAFTANVTVPAGAIVGSTRMRVVCVETSSAANVNSCGTYTYGETEDYTINIASGSVARPQDGNAIAEGTILEKANVLVYPNPTTDFVNIEFTQLAPNAKVFITNTLGQVVYQSEIAENRFTLDMSKFGAGLYIMQIKAENGEITERIVKR